MRRRDTLSGSVSQRRHEANVTPKNDLPQHVDTRPAAPPGQRTFTSQELFEGADEIVLLHNGAQYRLRVTRQDKLILTK